MQILRSFLYELRGISVHWKPIQQEVVDVRNMGQPWGGLTTEFLYVCRNASACILFIFLYKSEPQCIDLRAKSNSRRQGCVLCIFVILVEENE